MITGVLQARGTIKATESIGIKTSHRDRLIFISCCSPASNSNGLVALQLLPARRPNHFYFYGYLQVVITDIRAGCKKLTVFA
jgi:hypothetical protein